MIWGWLGISAVSLCVAYSMAELCSEYPVAGGQYTWVYILAPRSVRRQFSYLTGWFMIIGKSKAGPTVEDPYADFCRNSRYGGHQ